MKKIIITIVLAALVVVPAETLAQSNQSQPHSLLYRMRKNKIDNKVKKANDKRPTVNGKTTVNKNMTNKERAGIIYNLLKNMIKMPGGTMYFAGNKTTVKDCRINRRAVTNREYAAATNVWLNSSAPDAPAVVNNSQRQLFLTCLIQAIDRKPNNGQIVRLATQDEVDYGKSNGHLSTGNSNHIYFCYRGYWESDIQRKSLKTIFGEKVN